MTGKIEAFLDCVSPYSYFALLYLFKSRAALKSHGVEIELHPIFLGGVNQGSGNKPPWTLPAKAKYSPFDSKRAKKYFGAENVTTPDFFPIVSLLPQRAMVFVKEKYPSDAFESSFQGLWVAMWEQGKDLSKPEILDEVLQRFFPSHEVKTILEAATQAEYKQKLNENTKRALDLGAFGAPWFWVTNHKGEAEPFFGSDRFHFMWSFLDVPFNDLSIREAPKL